MKTMLSAGAIALTIAIGTIPVSADEWHEGWNRGYPHHYHHAQYRARPYYAQPRYYGRSSYAPAYNGGYARRSAYNAGFNAGAFAQWTIAYRRWQYEYALWRQMNGPTGIFALASETSYGGGGGYGSSYGTPCNCDQ